MQLLIAYLIIILFLTTSLMVFGPWEAFNDFVKLAFNISFFAVIIGLIGWALVTVVRSLV